MAERIEKKEFIRRLAERAQTDESTAAQWLDGILEEMYQTFRSGYGLTLPDFGGFYLDRRRESWAFKFNPAQKLRAFFGWSSTYRADYHARQGVSCGAGQPGQRPYNDVRRRRLADGARAVEIDALPL